MIGFIKSLTMDKMGMKEERKVKNWNCVRFHILTKSFDLRILTNELKINREVGY